MIQFIHRAYPSESLNGQIAVAGLFRRAAPGAGFILRLAPLWMQGRHRVTRRCRINALSIDQIGQAQPGQRFKVAMRHIRQDLRRLRCDGAYERRSDPVRL